MSERRRIYRDAGGVRRTSIWDDEDPDQKVTILTQQDVEPILDGIARDRELGTHDGDNRRLASIPVEIWERSCREQWDEGDWARFLNDPDYAHLRVWRGRV